MQCSLQLIFLTIAILFKVCKPGGTKALIAENLTLRQQLLVVSRKQKRAPNLKCRLNQYQMYFNRDRSRMGINAKTPNEKLGTSKNILNFDNYKWQSYSRKLFQLPVAA